MTEAPILVEDMPFQDELRSSFLEYGMSVVTSRALPDVRDGLKPVHRRVLYSMHEQGLTPERDHVKCARVVGDVMGKYHPHGDTAIYDSLVRMARDFAMRLPLVDPHGNFGTHSDPPAAMRYTESRMAPSAVAMTADLDEGTVDWEPNYDGKLQVPTVLPAAFPNLLVNGTTGIAVSMASNMPPHHLGEIVEACKHLLAHPDATVEDLMALVPGPDLPTGGLIVGLDGIREAYRTGRGKFTMRATTKIVDISARRKGIVVTELPYNVGPEKVIEDIKAGKEAGRLDGVADDVVDLSDRKNGLRLEIPIKTGFNPTAVLEALFRRTGLQVDFTVHNLALVNRQPQTLTLLDLVRHFVTHRLDVTTRRCTFRRAAAQKKAHVLEGYVIALASIEDVIGVIRRSSDTAGARRELTRRFELSDIQAAAILEMPLRRLTNLEVGKIEADLAVLHAQIAELTRLLEDDGAMRTLIATELTAAAAQFGNPRRTRLLAQAPAVDAAVEDQLPDTPCVVTLSTSGVLGRFEVAPFRGVLGKHDALVAAVTTSTRATVGLVTSTGRLHRLPVVEVPAASGRNRGAMLSEFLELDTGERPVALVSLAAPQEGWSLAMATAGGVLRRLPAEGMPTKTALPIIGLKDGDELVGAVWAAEDTDLLVVTSDAQALRTPAEGVRPQKAATAGGMAGIKLGEGARVIGFGDAGQAGTALVTLTDGGTVKRTDAADIPTKGRAGVGVRCMRLLKGETALVGALVAAGDPVTVTSDGDVTALTAPPAARDAAGVKVEPAPALLALARR